MNSKAIFLVIVLALAASAAAQQQRWQYGTLLVSDSSVTWYAPGEDYTADSLNGFVEAMKGRLALPTSVLASTRGSFATVLNILGYEGWELVSDSGTVMVFKRARE